MDLLVTMCLTLLNVLLVKAICVLYSSRYQLSRVTTLPKYLYLSTCSNTSTFSSIIVSILKSPFAMIITLISETFSSKPRTPLARTKAGGKACLFSSESDVVVYPPRTEFNFIQAHEVSHKMFAVKIK